MKSITLKINGQTFKHEIKVWALKDTSWIKPHYLARFVFVLKVSNNHSCYFLIAFVLLNCLKRGMAFHIAGWMKNGLCRKLICCSNCILLKLNNVCSYIKRRWVSLNEQWPLRCRIPNPGVLDWEQLGGSKVNTAILLPEVDWISTRKS